MYGCIEKIRRQDKPTFLYYFGDIDPSGVDIPRIVEEGIRELASFANLHFEPSGRGLFSCVDFPEKRHSNVPL